MKTNNMFSKILLEYWDMFNGSIPRAVYRDHISPFYLYRGNFTLSRYYRPKLKDATFFGEPIIDNDELYWLSSQIEERRANGTVKIYDYQIIQAPLIAPDISEIHVAYKTIRSVDHYQLKFNYNMTHAELDEMYKIIHKPYEIKENETANPVL